MQVTERHREYWRRNLRLISGLLAVCLLVTFVPILFARELEAFNFFGWPIPFYMAAQGALIVYVILVRIYAVRMDKLDREFGVGEGD